MINIKFRLLTALILFSLVGCVSAPPDLSGFNPKSQIINVNKVVISNLEIEAKFDKYASVWTSGFVPLHNSSTVPPFNQLLISALRTGVVGDNRGGSNILEISILRAELLMEVRMADSVAFVGILSALADRQHMCRLDASFRYDQNSERKQFEVFTKGSRAWGDLETADKDRLVRDCVDQIILKVKDYANTLAKN